MNDDNPTMNNSYSQPTPDKKKSNKKPVVLIVAIVLLIVVAIVSYLVVANNSKFWPFATNSSAVDEPSLKITKVALSGEKNKEVVKIDLKLNSKDEGYCVLTMSNKQAGLTIDDSKLEKEPGATAQFENCLGWSVSTTGLPNGTYKLNVKFVGSNSKLSASSEVTLKNGTTLEQISDDGQDQ